MKYFVGINWNISLLKEIVELNRIYEDNVTEVYGSLKNDPIGNVREPNRLVDIKKTNFEEFAENAIENNVKLCYAMNSPTIIPGMIYDKKDEISDFIHWLIDIGFSNVIVSSPALAMWIKEKFEKIGIIGSTVMDIRTLEQIETYKGIFSRLCISTDRNRDLQFLKEANEIIELELLANEMCLLNCPWRRYHYIQESMSKNFGNYEKYEDFPVTQCWMEFISKEGEFLKSQWIRPEDVKYYENIGIKWMKLSGRTMTSQWIVRTIESYLNRKHHGNLLDLFPLIPGKISSEKIGQHEIFISNKYLENFLEGLLQNYDSCVNGCNSNGCDYCVEYWKLMVEKKEVSFNR